MRFHEFKGLAPLRNALSDGHSSPQRNGFRFRVRTLVSLLTPASFAKQPIIGIATHTHKCEYGIEWGSIDSMVAIRRTRHIRIIMVKLCFFGTSDCEGACEKRDRNISFVAK